MRYALRILGAYILEVKAKAFTIGVSPDPSRLRIETLKAYIIEMLAFRWLFFLSSKFYVESSCCIVRFSNYEYRRDRMSHFGIRDLGINFQVN